MYKRKIPWKPIVYQNINSAPKEDNFSNPHDTSTSMIKNDKNPKKPSKRNDLEKENTQRKQSPSILDSEHKQDVYSSSGVEISQHRKDSQSDKLSNSLKSNSQSSSICNLEMEQDRKRKEYFDRRWAEVKEFQRKRESPQSRKQTVNLKGDRSVSQSSVLELDIEDGKEYFDEKWEDLKNSQSSKSDKKSNKSKQDLSESRSSNYELEIEQEKIRKKYFDKKLAEVEESQRKRKSHSQSSTQGKSDYLSDDDMFSSQTSNCTSNNRKHLNSNENLEILSQEILKQMNKKQLPKNEVQKQNKNEKTTKNNGTASIDKVQNEKVLVKDGKKIKSTENKIFLKKEIKNALSPSAGSQENGKKIKNGEIKEKFQKTVQNDKKGGKQIENTLCPSADLQRMDKYRKQVSKSKREELKLSLSPKQKFNRQDKYYAEEKMQTLFEERVMCGTFVCCDKCDKQRYLENINDPLDLPEKWYCYMNSDTRYNNCAAPEEETSEDPLNIKYNVGSIVWAKLDGYPWWPAMVDICPDTMEFFWLEEDDYNPTWYNVTFFDKNEVSRAWCRTGSILKYEDNWPNVYNVRKQLGNRYLHAVAEAQQALKTELSERVAKFSFVARYKGKINLPNDDDAFVKKTKKSQKRKKVESGLVGQRAAVQKKAKFETMKKKMNNSQKDKDNIDYMLNNNLDPDYFEENELML